MPRASKIPKEEWMPAFDAAVDGSDDLEGAFRGLHHWARREYPEASGYAKASAKEIADLVKWIDEIVEEAAHYEFDASMFAALGPAPKAKTKACRLGSQVQWPPDMLEAPLPEGDRPQVFCDAGHERRWRGAQWVDGPECLAWRQAAFYKLMEFLADPALADLEKIRAAGFGGRPEPKVELFFKGGHRLATSWEQADFPGVFASGPGYSRLATDPESEAWAWAASLCRDLFGARGLALADGPLEFAIADGPEPWRLAAFGASDIALWTAAELAAQCPDPAARGAGAPRI